jgi:hypothetical protein
MLQFAARGGFAVYCMCEAADLQPLRDASGECVPRTSGLNF